MRHLSLIVAIAENGVIGNAGGLPSRIPADLKRFKALTLGHPVIMGRKTYESIGKPLPGRGNIVVTRDSGWRALGVWVASTPAEALAMGRRQPGAEEIFVIGGAEIFDLMLPLATRLHLTRIHRDYAGDTDFPDYDPAMWQEIWREDHADKDPPYSFLILERAA